MVKVTRRVTFFYFASLLKAYWSGIRREASRSHLMMQIAQSATFFLLHQLRSGYLQCWSGFVAKPRDASGSHKLIMVAHRVTFSCFLKF